MYKFKLLSQLPRTDEDVRRHINALTNMANAKGHEEIFDHLYSCLSILDSKSSSLLAFNSIIIAVFAIFMTGDLGLSDWAILNGGMVSILISSLLLLSVVWVHWSTTENLADLENHALILLTVRKRRTIKYRLAWYLAVTSVLCLAGFIVMRLLREVF